MVRILVLILALMVSSPSLADVKISQLPLAAPGSVNTDDVFPYVDTATQTTRKLKLSTIPSIPAFVTSLGAKEGTISGGTTAQYWRGDKSFQTLNTDACVEATNLYFTNARARGAISASSPVSYSSSTGAISMAAASASQNGYLSSTDWSTFNGKQDAGNYITALSSDVSASGPGSVAATVNSVGGSTAALVHAAELLANAATNSNTVSAIVKRDGSGNFSAGTITANLTGTASGNTTYTPSNHGVVVSGSGNTMTVVGPDSSTAKALISGGSSADPAYGILSVAGGGTGLTGFTAHNLLTGGSAGTALGSVAPSTSGNYLKSDGTDWTSAALSSNAVTSFAKSGSTALVGAVTISGGSNVTLTQSGNNVSIAASSSTPTLVIQTKTANYTVQGTDDYMRGSGTFAFTLPAATGSGKVFYFKNTGTGVITITPNGSDTIDGEASQALYNQGESAILVDAASATWEFL